MNSSEYVPYKPSVVLAVESGGGRPPVLCDPDYPLDDALSVEPCYEFRAAFVLRNDLVGTMEIPMSMHKYGEPAKGDEFNEAICTEIDKTNAMKQAHNSFVIDLVRAWQKKFDVGASAGQVTMPPPPIVCSEARINLIKTLFSDKPSATKKAIIYLGERGLYCIKDFEYDAAVDVANEVAYKEECERRAAGGRVRVCVFGRRSCWWDGKSDVDENGRRVAWEKGEGHTFLTPCVAPRAITENDQLAIDITTAGQVDKVSDDPVRNPFADLI